MLASQRNPLGTTIFEVSLGVFSTYFFMLTVSTTCTPSARHSVSNKQLLFFLFYSFLNLRNDLDKKKAQQPSEQDWLTDWLAEHTKKRLSLLQTQKQQQQQQQLMNVMMFVSLSLQIDVIKKVVLVSNYLSNQHDIFPSWLWLFSWAFAFPS